MPHYTRALFEVEDAPKLALETVDATQVVRGDRVVGPDGRWSTVIEIMPTHAAHTVLGLQSVAAPSGYVWQSFTGQIPVRRGTPPPLSPAAT